VNDAVLIASEEELLRRKSFEDRQRRFVPRGRLSAISANPYLAISEDNEVYGEEIEAMNGHGAAAGEHALNVMSNPSPSIARNPAQPNQGSNMGGSNRGNKLTCHYCGRNNHFVRDCREKTMDVNRGIFRANKFQPIPAAAAGRYNQSGVGMRGGKASAQQGKEEAHHRE
jgi:hypothetical protein